jgi:rhodanese-related sulfurtransferase
MDKTKVTAAAPNIAKTLRLALFALVLSSAIVLFFKEPPYKNLENDQLQIMLKNNVPIYDVRRPEEWKQTGVIEGSHLLTLIDANGQVKPNFLSRFTTEIGKDDSVILICRTGNRTSKLARHLVENLGYTNVFNVEDGITQWIRDNRPVKNMMRHTSEANYSRGML